MTCRCPCCRRRLVAYDGERTGRKQGSRRRCRTCKQTVLWLLNENGSFSPPFELPDEVGGWYHHCCCGPARARVRTGLRGRYLYQGELDPDSPAAAAPVRCRRCGRRVRAYALDEHRRAVPCPDCDAEVRRDRLDRHRTRRCPGRAGAAGA